MSSNSTVYKTEGYDPEAARVQYQLEKENGHRLPNGAKPLKKLTKKHKQMIQLHLEGMSNNDIAEGVGMTPSRVSIILNDPLARAWAQSQMQDFELEFQALFPKTVGVIRDALGAETQGGAPAFATRLKAADLYYKASGRYKDAEEKGETAEDVIQRILANPLVQINIESPAETKRVGRTFDGELEDGSSNTDD